MRYLRNQHKILIIIVVFSFLSIISSDTRSENKIAFLRFRIDSTTVSLTKSTLVEGHLKKSRTNNSSKEIYFEVVSKKSKLLSSGNLENPLVKRLEYENPNKPGELLHKIVNFESMEFTIRIDYNSQIDRINFYRSQYDKDIQTIRNSENLIGSVSLTSITGGEND